MCLFTLTENLALSMHVRQLSQKWLWNQDQISLAEHMAAPWVDGVEYEVDKVEVRSAVRPQAVCLSTSNTRKYSVSDKA